MTTNPPKTAVLLIAHGSRRTTANEDLIQLANAVIDRGPFDYVGVSYLELAEPTIFSGGRICVEQGATRILMLPYFLSAGVHVVTDLENQRNELTAAFPDVEFILCSHLGLHPMMIEIVLDRLRDGADRARSEERISVQ